MKLYPRPSLLCWLAILSFVAVGLAQREEEHMHVVPASEEGLGHAHMDTSCSPRIGTKFDRALALLHNFWYSRALQAFQQVAKDDPECAMAWLRLRTSRSASSR